MKPVDLSQIAGVGGRHEEVDDVVKSDQSIPISRVAVWIDPLDATQEYTGNSIFLKSFITTKSKWELPFNRTWEI